MSWGIYLALTLIYSIPTISVAKKWSLISRHINLVLFLALEIVLFKRSFVSRRSATGKPVLLLYGSLSLPTIILTLYFLFLRDL